jgi:hypothetical protein
MSAEFVATAVCNKSLKTLVRRSVRWSMRRPAAVPRKALKSAVRWSCGGGGWVCPHTPIQHRTPFWLVRGRNDRWCCNSKSNGRNAPPARRWGVSTPPSPTFAAGVVLDHAAYANGRAGWSSKRRTRTAPSRATAAPHARAGAWGWGIGAARTARSPAPFLDRLRHAKSHVLETIHARGAGPSYHPVRRGHCARAMNR